MGRGQLLPVHQKVAVAGDGDHRAPGGDGAGDARRHAVAHGAVGGRQLRLVALGDAVVVKVAVRPAGKVAGAVGEGGVLGQQLLQRADDGVHVHRAGQRLRLHVGDVVGMHGLGPVAPGLLVWRLQRRQRGGGGRQAGAQGQVGLVHAAQLLGAGVHVDQLLRRPRHAQQAIAAGGHLAQARADGEDQVGIGDALAQPGVDGDAHVAGVQRVVVVEGVLKAHGVAHRQLPGFGKRLQVARGLGRPAATAHDDHRLLRFQQHLAQALHGFGRGLVGGRLPARHGLQGVGHGLGQHVLGQHQHHRAGAAVQRGGKGARHVFGQALGAVDALDALGHAEGAEEGAVTHLLERLAVALVAGHIADEQHHRRRILAGRVHADAGIGRPRPAGDEAHARPPRQLAVRLGHEGGTALLPADDEVDRVAVLVKAVQHRQIAFARHAERVGDALGQKAFDEKVACDASHALIL